MDSTTAAATSHAFTSVGSAVYCAALAVFVPVPVPERDGDRAGEVADLGDRPVHPGEDAVIPQQPPRVRRAARPPQQARQVPGPGPAGGPPRAPPRGRG